MGSAAVGVVADALGLSEKTEGAIKQALAGATPEHMLALKKADQDFAVKMQELGFAQVKDLESIAAGDRDSARKREMEVKDHTPRNLAYAITVGFFSVLMFLMFADLPDKSKDVLYIMLGTLGTSWTACISYYFGSTNGSKAKSELLARAQPVKD
jgi:hypothetical protein